MPKTIETKLAALVEELDQLSASELLTVLRNSLCETEPHKASRVFGLFNSEMQEIQIFANIEKGE